MKKRVIKILLAVAIAVSLIVAVNLVANAATSGIYTYTVSYTVSGGKATIVSCDTSDSGTVEIPSTLGGYPVTAIEAWSFDECALITGITIPDSVESIGDYAFNYCEALKSVYITDLSAWCNISFANRSSNPIYHDAKLYLNGVEVTDLIIPEGVTEIPNYAFTHLSIESVTIPNSVTRIGSNAFEYCALLESVTIPGSVKTVGDSAFRECTSLTDVVMSDGVTAIYDWAFFRCTSLVSLKMPDSITEIGEMAFSECTSLTSVVIPKGVHVIEESVFYNCSSITSVTIHENVWYIKQWAFDGCSSLSEVYFSGNKMLWDSMNIKGNGTLRNATLYTFVHSLPDAVDYKLRCTVKAKANEDTIILKADTPNTSSVKVRFGNLPEGATLSLKESNQYVTVGTNNMFTIKNPGVGKLSVPVILTNADGNKKTLSFEVDFGNVLRLVNTCSTFQSGTDLKVYSGSATAYILFDIRDITGGYIEVGNVTRNLLNRYVVTDATAGAIRFYHPSYDEGSVTVNVKNASGEIVRSHEVEVVFHSGKDSAGDYIVKEYTPVHSVLRCSYEVNGDTITVQADHGADDVYLNFARYQGETLTASVNDEFIKKTGARSWRIMACDEPVEFDLYFDATAYDAEKVTRHITVSF
ncbi:MAG: leucine-rich repeat domain-containing protein [Clostridia bacterium]|nr:leucine-rich repeat domain-containing protein [Clostridia bacterium]